MKMSPMHKLGAVLDKIFMMGARPLIIDKLRENCVFIATTNLLCECFKHFTKGYDTDESRGKGGYPRDEEILR
jgi:hypothetical protein